MTVLGVWRKILVVCRMILTGLSIAFVPISVFNYALSIWGLGLNLLESFVLTALWVLWLVAYGVTRLATRRKAVTDSKSGAITRRHGNRVIRVCRKTLTVLSIAYVPMWILFAVVDSGVSLNYAVVIAVVIYSMALAALWVLWLIANGITRIVTRLKNSESKA
ncbi:MAG: hypothetical protein LBN02_09525 [Oscillospiraceae bacterium]|jgi:hypothetical protein|nr:hypothetical protein [Oscillospiraceae bacterium]